MSHHIFRLLDRHQKLDEALRIEQKQREPTSTAEAPEACREAAAGQDGSR
jgi:uncharacterized protein YdcH (DUF465 family)